MSEEITVKIDMERWRKVKKNKGCLCKVQRIIVGNSFILEPIPCPCEELENLEVGKFCHCRTFLRI